MDKLDIVTKCLLGFMLLMFVIIISAIAIDFDNYQNPKLDLNKTKVGDYLLVNGVIKSYLGETGIERLICSKGCITTYRTKQAYIVLTQNQEITVLFNDKQQINSTIIVKVRVRQTYFDEV